MNTEKTISELERADEILRNLIKELKKEYKKKPTILTPADCLSCIPTIIHIIFILSRVQWDADYRTQNGMPHRTDDEAQPPDIR